MNTSDLIQAISAGICFYAGITHLMIGLRSQPRDRVHLSFAVVSLLFGLYSVGLFGLYAAFDTGSLSRYVLVDKWGLALNYLAYAALFWFIGAYAGANNRIVPLVLTGLYVLIAISNFILPYTWVYTGIELTVVFPPDIIVAPWYSVEQVITLFWYSYTQPITSASSLIAERRVQPGLWAWLWESSCSLSYWITALNTG